MAWPSPPRTFFCPACGWKHTMAFPMDDCRIPGLNHFSECPRCGGKAEAARLEYAIKATLTHGEKLSLIAAPEGVGEWFPALTGEYTPVEVPAME